MCYICVYILLYTGSEIPVSLSRFEHQLGGMGHCDKLYRLVIPANSIVKMQIKYCSIHCRTSWVKVNGVCYKKGVVVITDRLIEATDYPGFAQIEEVLIASDRRPLLGLKTLNVECYSEHHRTYMVNVTEHSTVTLVSKLASLQVCNSDVYHYIILPLFIFV